MCLPKNNWQMDNKFEKIDNYYKKHLGNYSENTEKDIWKNMRWSLMWMRYRWLAGLGIVLLLAGTGGLIYLGYNNYGTDNYNSIMLSDNSFTSKTNEAVTVITYPVSKIEEGTIETKDVKYAIEKSIPNSETIATESETVIISNSNQTINTGKANPNVEIEAVILSEEIPLDNNTYNNEMVELSQIRSKEINFILSSKTDTTFGQNIVKRKGVQNIKQQRFSLVVYAGPAYSQTNILGDNNEYLDFRNANESNYGSWSMGAELKIHLKNWIITSGLSYSVYNQSRSYMHTYQEYSPENSYYNHDTTWAWFFDPPEIGAPVVVGVDSNWVKVYNDITIDNSGINQVSYLEIPLLVGYRYNASLFSFEINTGAYLGFLMNSNIRVPDFVNNNEIVDPQETNKSMVNFAVNASVYYHLNRNTSVFLSPYYKQNTGSLFKDSYPVNQRLKTYGINFGISYSF